MIRRRRSASIFGIVALVVAVGVLVGVSLLPSANSSPKATQPKLPATVSANDVVTLQMFTDADGVAVARVPNHQPCDSTCRTAVRAGAGRDYLAITTDGGATWRTRGILPSVTTASTTDPRLAFANPAVGYLLVSSPSRSWFFGTRDGGRTWADLRTPHPVLSVSAAGGVVWAITNPCEYSSDANPPARSCPFSLLSYGTDARRPLSESPFPMPLEIQIASATMNDVSPDVLVRSPTGLAVIAEGFAGPRNVPLFVTRNSGRSWQQFVSPCEDFAPTGFAVAPSGRWLLDCQLGGGMNRGSVNFYVSDDQGQRWTLINTGRDGDQPSGDIGDQMTGPLTVSGDGHVLWRVGTATGVTFSTDGGYHWSVTSLSTGGAVPLVTAGARAAWLVTVDEGLWRTLDGIHWRRLG